VLTTPQVGPKKVSCCRIIIKRTENWSMWIFSSNSNVTVGKLSLGIKYSMSNLTCYIGYYDQSFDFGKISVHDTIIIIT